MVIAANIIHGTMKQNEVTIAGKQVHLGYCYATEIAYKDYTNEDIRDFMQEAFLAINDQPQRMPDAKKTTYLILSAIVAYYESVQKQAPVKDSDLLYNATPQEIGTALGVVIPLWSQFYALPADEPKDKEKKGSKGKN